MCRRFNSGSRHQFDMQNWPPPTDGESSPPRPNWDWNRIAHRFAVQIVALALALALLSGLAPGIVTLPPFGQIEYLATLIAFAAILAAVNIILRPLIYLLFGPLACLLIVLTFGTFHFILGAVLLLWASEVVPGVTVGGFGSALLAALLTSLAATLASALFVREAPVQVQFRRGRWPRDPESGSEPD